MKTSTLGVAALLCATGCDNPPPTSKLTQEQMQIVQTLVEQLEASESFQSALVEHADEEASFDENGQTGAQPYQESVSEAIDLARQLVEQGRVYGYRASEGTGEYATSNAFFDENADGPYIGVNVEGGALENLPSSTILHETLHGQDPSHSLAIQDAKHESAENFDYQSSSFIQLVIEEQDLPYLASLYADVSDKAFWYAQTVSAQELIDSYEQQGKSPEEIYELLLAQPLAQGKEAWVEDVIDGMYDDYLSDLGITKDELHAQLLESTCFFEPSHEQFMESTREYRERAIEAQEARREMRFR